MSADETPAGVGDLARAVRQAREDLLALGRTLTGLAAAYDRIPDEDLSEADRAARIEIIDSLSDVHLALNDAAEPFENAVWNADHLGPS
ncbi:hypothetical protein [Prescottella agglutinans]|uniref:Uncharacterized protein n=1 Tax=Prescottella agglutinans TaxID=1644129 RepID=A0ABT6MJS4_9NOCA|nr:hypothetical protein [Prescottella agglutinans]MDH6284542.1 hypothetical protein [Prescottella agglutinans]